MNYWAELRWLIATELIAVAMKLTRREWSDDCRAAMYTLAFHFGSDPRFRNDPKPPASP